MKSTLYISSERIELVGHEGGAKQSSIKEYASCPTPEGSVIGGKIIAVAPLAEAIAALCAANPQLAKNPTLLVDGSFLFSKKLPLPKLKRPQYLKLIEEEFAGAVEDSAELICDYHILTNNGDKGSLLAFAIEKPSLEAYLAVMEEAGVKPEKIRLGMEAVIHSVEQTPALADRTYVLNLVDGVSLLSLVFHRGESVLISRTRLYYEGMESLANTLSDNLSGLMQFNRSQQLDDIEASYYMGLSVSELSYMKENNAHSGLEIAPFTPAQEPSGMHKLDEHSHFPQLSIQLPEKSIDFLHNYENIKKIRKSQQKKDRKPLLFAAAAAVVLVPLLALGVNKFMIDRSIQSAQDYLASTVVIEKSKELDELSAKTDYYLAVKAQIAQRDLQLAARPSFDSELIDFIVQSGSGSIQVSLVDYDAGRDAVAVNGACSNETFAAAYVEALKLNPKIKNISYTGYNFGDRGQGQFYFSLELLLAAKEAEAQP